MKKILGILSILLFLSCGNNTTETQNEKVDSLTQKINELTAKENERERQKQIESEKLKQAEVQEKKDIIIEQIKTNDGSCHRSSDYRQCQTTRSAD